MNHSNYRGRGTANTKQNQFPVTEPGELMKFLTGKLPALSRNNIKSLLTHRQIQVNGQVVTQYNHPLKAGDQVAVDWSLVRDAGQGPGLKILYEDADLMIIDKPAGLLSIASNQEKLHTAYHQLTDYVRQSDPDAHMFIVHRLDRDTSGVMLFAKNETAKRRLQDAWKEMVTDRAYVALVEGQVKKAGSIKSWLKETKTGLMYSSSIPADGLEAVTHYRVLQATPEYSLLELRLETGRKNQIRVHMKDMGHSIVGDRKYGAVTNPLGRLGLHAHILAFYHPVTGKLMRFETEIPQKFSRLLKRG
jgi:23S rRNA pseudouridine1911/1915/1917 synthase